jgi:hypothetical protein
MKYAVWFSLACALVFGIPRGASAQDGKAAKRVEDLNRAAMEEYDLAEVESARKTLGEAVALVKRSKLERHAVAAKTFMNVAIVLGGGLRDTPNAVAAMTAALAIDPSLKLDPGYKTPELQKVYDEAHAAVRRGSEPEGPEGEAEEEPEAAVTGLKHTPIDEAGRGRVIPVQARVGGDLAVKQVLVFYRQQGAEDFVPVIMKGKGTTYRAEIPAKATRGEAIHYYIEARHAGGKVLATIGNSGSPNIITIVAGGGAEEETGVDEENPLAGVRKREAEESETRIGKGATPARHKFFIGVSAGTGGGYVSGTTEKERQPVSCCVAPELLNLKPEVGYWISAQLVGSLYFRIGLPIGANVEGAAFMAPAVMAKLSYLLDPERGSGVVLHGDVGAGLTRQTVKLKDVDDAAHDTDTHATGPMLVGGGASWVKPIGGSMRFFVDGTALVGLPVVDTLGTAKPGFGISLDLNVGLAMHF